ncbi:MAG TPA: hypothetical protein VI731_02865 [Bacteroidia bacterium]|nr:hypothetical protein [Bacteroidia bacterium]
MRSLIFLWIGLISFIAATESHANEEADSISYVLIKSSGRSSLDVLQLKNSGRYDHTRYTNKRIYHDYGVYELQRGKVTFESRSKKKEFPSVAGRTYYISKKGMFKTKGNALFGKKPMLVTSTDPEHRRGWDYNPLTGKTLEEMKPVPKVDPRLAEAKKREAVEIYTRNYYLNIAATYAPPYKWILDKAYCGPECFATVIDHAEIKWSQDTSSATLFNDFETVIHESTHKYNSTFPTPGLTGYLVEPGVEITVTPTPTFYSSEIKDYAPQNAQSEIFRYNTYLSDSSKLSGNVAGIYGLMDEYSAYHNGVKACVIAAQTAYQRGDTARAASFVAQAAGTYFAHYEFNLFVAWYLRAAKNQHPEIHQELLANKNLRVAFTLLDAGFKETNEQLKDISSKIKSATGTDHLASNELQYAAPAKKMLPKEKATLDSFRVKGVNKTNYFTYLN